MRNVEKRIYFILSLVLSCVALVLLVIGSLSGDWALIILSTVTSLFSLLTYWFYGTYP